MDATLFGKKVLTKFELKQRIGFSLRSFGILSFSCHIGPPVTSYMDGPLCSFVPSMLRSVQAWNEKQREQVSHLNIELVHILRSNDHAFSLGV
jgi:hypothetical protein